MIYDTGVVSHLKMLKDSLCDRRESAWDNQQLRIILWCSRHPGC